MLREYTHTKSECLVQICTAMAEIQHFFLGDCFLLAHPVFGNQEMTINYLKHLNLLTFFLANKFIF